MNDAEVAVDVSQVVGRENLQTVQENQDLVALSSPDVEASRGFRPCDSWHHFNRAEQIGAVVGQAIEVAATERPQPERLLERVAANDVYPIFRSHSQSGTDYFGLPETFTATDPYFTSDRELSEFTSDKFGIGFRRVFEYKRSGWLSKLRSFETRLTTYSREDGLDAISASFAIGLRLRSFQ